MKNRNLKTIIVDDEKPSRDALSTYIRDFCPNIEVVAECDAIKPAYAAIRQFEPDLVFLDIEMPNGNGFDLLMLFKPVTFKVIFVTAFSEYAIQAFRFAAADYLLKPIKVDELLDAVEKVRKELDLIDQGSNINVLMDNLNGHNLLENKLVIPHAKGFSVLKTHEIVMCKADGYITHFYMTDKSKYSSSKNLKYYEDLLEQSRIIRVHHSCLINLQHVISYSHQGEIILTGNLTAPLGNNYKHHFLEAFGRIK
jgi:two-component system, LytTR family, response regulator